MNQICWFKRFSVAEFLTKAFSDNSTGMASRSPVDMLSVEINEQNYRMWSLRITGKYAPYGLQWHWWGLEVCTPANTEIILDSFLFPQSPKLRAETNVCIVISRVHLSSHLSKERNDSLVMSPIFPRKDGGSRLGSTVTSSEGGLTRLRRISFTFFPFESAGREGLTSEDKVDKASEMASGPWVTPADDRSPSLAAVEVWSSPMPESYRRMDTSFPTSPEIVLLSKNRYSYVKRWTNSTRCDWNKSDSKFQRDKQSSFFLRGNISEKMILFLFALVYLCSWLTGTVEGVSCHCGAPECRGTWTPWGLRWSKQQQEPETEPAYCPPETNNIH